jgi:hypothetical protein
MLDGVSTTNANERAIDHATFSWKLKCQTCHFLPKIQYYLLVTMYDFMINF